MQIDLIRTVVYRANERPRNDCARVGSFDTIMWKSYEKKISPFIC